MILVIAYLALIVVSAPVVVFMFATSGAKRLEGGSWLKVGNATKMKRRYSKRVKPARTVCVICPIMAYSY